MPNADPTRYAPDYLETQRLDLPPEGWQSGGMHVVLEHIRGITRQGLLTKPFRFQMPPTDNFSRQLSHAHTDFDTLNSGQHSRTVGSQLEIVSFPTLLIEWDHPLAVWPNSAVQGTLADADRARTWNLLNITWTLERILDSGSPVLLKAGSPGYWEGGGPTERYGWDVHMPATLRDLTIEQRPGEIDARYLNVEFHEWRKLDATVLNRKKKGRGGKGKGGGKGRTVPTTVEINSAGTAKDLGNGGRRINNVDLHKLAKHFYGDADAWRTIRRSNSITERHNWIGSRGLGALSTQHNNGRAYKLYIPVVATTAMFADEG